MRGLVLGLLGIAVIGRAQDAPLGSRPELARIEAPQNLSAWAAALQDLSAGARTRVSVCHFGDSHLQAGQLDGVLRYALQQRWGEAGRGYVFPFEASYTSNPPDLASASDVEWNLRRMMGDGMAGAVGAGGLTAIPRSVPFVLSLAQRKAVAPSGGFDRVRVYYEPSKDNAELWVATRADASAAEAALRTQAWQDHPVLEGETLSGIAQAESVTVADLRRWNGVKNRVRVGQVLRLRQAINEDASRLAGYTIWGVLKGDDPAGRRGLMVDLGSPVSQVFLLGAQATASQVSAEIQGASLERAGAKGLIWNTLAANGAQAKHFAHAVNFSEQLASMTPDLLIVTLGTNETQQKDFDQSTALAEQKRFWQLLRQVAPQASLLICSPPDAIHQRHRPKERLDDYVRGLRMLALNEGAAFLDLRAAQGGDGSYARWREDGYAGKDGVHYNGPGYRLMGHWMLDALQNLEPAP